MNVRLLAVEVMIIAALLAMCAGQASAQAQAGPGAARIKFVKNPKPVPDFSVTTLDGRKLTPSAIRGKVAILNFWATWCGPCRMEIPHFIAIQKKYADRLVIIGLSADETGQKGVEQFVAAHQMNYPVAMASPELQEAFGGIVGLPTSFVVDREGRVVQKHVGLYSAETFELEVRALLGLPVNAVIETFEDKGQISLENAAEANSIPGLDLSKLAPEKKRTALQRLNAERCTCGCKLTLAQCRINDPACGVSLPLAKKVVDQIGRAANRP
jgi:cytochrome c biogenesis protein CcmG/thiol:disulfide interchange protein DsbE